jgi:hypothetical protein
VINSATIILDGAASAIIDETSNDALTGFSTNAASAAFTLLDGRNFTTAGGFNNLGAMTFGLNSTFTVTGDFNQDTSAVLDVQIGDTPDTGQFGQLAVNGQAILAGTLSVQLVNGFEPGTNDQYSVMTSGMRKGEFERIDPPPGWMIKTNYDEMSLTIGFSRG